MPIDYDALMATAISDIPVTYTEKDAVLYALGVGLGREPDNARELPYVFEQRGLHIVPTLASMFSTDRILKDAGVDFTQALHRSQSLELYRPLPASGNLLANERVVSVVDLGASRGAEIQTESELRLARDDTVICLLGSRLIARADGGFGGPARPARSRHRMPGRDPDLTCDLRTRPDQALLFRLSGDLNPLHADPAAARRAGFDAPILHGRCTYAIACHAILKTVCDYDFTLITGFDVRFRAPVYPGDVVTTEMWQDRNIVSFRCRVKERDSLVIDSGKCTLAS